MKRVLGYIKKYGKEAFFAPVFKLLEAILELLIPLIVANIIDEGINGKVVGSVYRGVIIMVVFAAVGLAFSVLGQYFSAKAATGFARDLRGALYKKLLNSPLRVTDGIGVSAMITRTTSDVNQAQTGVNLFLRLLLRSPFVVVGAVIAAVLINAEISLVFVGVVVCLSVVVFIIMKITVPKYGEAQGKLDEVALAARENLTGVRVVRAFGVEEDEKKSFAQKTGAYEKIQNFAGKISSLLNPLTFATVNIGIIVLIYLGGIKVEVGILSQGAVVALYDYMSQILVELVKFANLIVTVSRAVASAKRIDKVLSNDEKEEIYEKIKISDEYIEFKGVAVNYGNGVRAVSDITFSVKKGQTIGIIGGTGSGKSTIVNLLPRLYDTSEGFLAVEGYDIKSYTPEEMREKVGIALQRPAVFEGTIRSNVLLGKQDASDEEILQAVDLAQATDILKAKGGLDAKIEQGGRNLSGGQRQRLALARALVKKPEILVLDDSSSALDYATDLNLRRAIAGLSYRPTVFIVSQRTASVKGADEIIVLDEGKTVGKGTHEYLMKTCETYREIEFSQTDGGLAL